MTTKKANTRIDPALQRLQIVKNDTGKGYIELGKIFNMSIASMSRIFNGQQPITFHVIQTVCFKLGYSPSWFLFGTGNKKMKGDEAKLVTEIQMLRVELDITANLNLRLQARLTGIENEYEDKFKQLELQIEELKNKKTG